MARLAGKVALISGGARGQGAAHGELFAREGARVVLGDILDAEAGQVAARLQADGLDVLSTHLDVTQPADWQAAVDLAERRFGKLDVLVNNAGISDSFGGPVEETLEGWNRIVAVNQTGVFLGMKHAIPALQRAGGGAIVNTSSILGLTGARGFIAYSATKGAIVAMTKSAALTHAKDGIRVNAVCPGVVETPMIAGNPPDVLQAFYDATPLGRAAQPHEISLAVLYLASDESAYVTGTELVVDGGFLAQ